MPAALLTCTSSSTRRCSRSGSRMLYDRRMLSARSMPLASPPCSDLTSNDISVSRDSPLSWIVSGCSGASTSAVSNSCAIAMLIETVSLLLHVVADGSQHLHELDRRRADRHDPDGGEDAQHEREHHLHARFCRGLFRALPPLGPQRIGEHAKRVGDAG